MSHKTTLVKLPPAWHAEAKELLSTNFAKINSQFLDSTKKAVWLGLFLNDIKFRGDKKTGDGSIPHGEFGPWLKTNVPSVSWTQANVYMRLAKDVCEKGKFQINGFREFAHNGELPDSVLKIVEGKTQQHLCLEFKQMKEVDGEFKPTRGRRPGEGGRPAELKGTIEEVAAALKKSTRRHCFKAGDELEKAGINFIAMDDAEIIACAAAYERMAKCMNAWVKTPATKRDGKEIAKLWKTS